MLKKIFSIIIVLNLALLLVSCTNESDIYQTTKALFKESETNKTEEAEGTIVYETKKEIDVEEKTHINLDKVMPEYREIIYSQAYFRKFKHNELRDAYGELADVINEQIMSNEENAICMVNFNNIEKYVLNYENSLVKEEEYKDLLDTEYVDIVKNNTTDLSTQNISLSIDVNTVKTYDLYYEFEGVFYKPILIHKQTIEELKKVEEDDEPQIIIDYPFYSDYSNIRDVNNIKEIKKTKMYYDGSDGFLYYLGKESQQNMREAIIKNYNDEYYAFYEDDDILMTHPISKTKIKIMRDASIGEGNNFYDVALKNEEYLTGDIDIKPLYSMDELFNMILNDEENILRFKTNFYANYILSDEKGYITDLFYLGEEQ